MTTKDLRWVAALCLWAAAAMLMTTPAGAQAPAPEAGPVQAVAPASVAPGEPAAYDSEQHPTFTVGRAIVRVGRDYTLRAGETVGEVWEVLGTTTLSGRVDRDVSAILGNVRLTNTAVIGRDLVVVGGSATVEAGAVVDGSLVIVGGTLTAPPEFSPKGEQVVVGTAALGEAIKAFVPWLTRGLLWARPIVPDLGWVWMVAGAFFLAYLATNMLFNGPVRLATAATLERPLTTFLLGLLVLIVSVPVLVVLAVTVVGIAVVPFFLCALLFIGLVGKAGVLRAIGASLVRQSSPESQLQSLRSFLLGSAAVTIVYMIPVLGAATWAVTGALGLGAAASSLRVMLGREHRRRDRSANGSPLPATPIEAPAGEAVSSPLPEALAGDLTLSPRATFLDRVAAFALDCLLVAIAVVLLGVGVLGEGGFPLFLLVYHIAFWAWKGTTLGGIVVGLRVVRTHGAELRAVDALVRGLSAIFSIAALGIGCFWMLQDPQGQMWHDKIAGTLVVKVPRDTILQ
jgi:uncharacterized RDD family membrane protein YckC